MTDPRKEPQCLAFQPPPRSMPLPPLHGRLLEGVKKQLGVVPNMFRLVANSPATLESYLALVLARVFVFGMSFGPRTSSEPSFSGHRRADMNDKMERRDSFSAWGFLQARPRRRR